MFFICPEVGIRTSFENMELIIGIDAPPLILFKEMDKTPSSWGCLGYGSQEVGGWGVAMGVLPEAHCSVSGGRAPKGTLSLSLENWEIYSLMPHRSPFNTTLQGPR